MIAEPTSPQGRKVTRPPFFAVPDESVSGSGRRAPEPAPATAATAGRHPETHATRGELQAQLMDGVADVTDVGGSDPDVADLSSSHGDGARYAVALGRTRHGGGAAASAHARVRLRRAIHGVRRVAANALRQRMSTEMADLAAQIRKLHDQDGSRR
jgi:hypothetical protein